MDFGGQCQSYDVEKHYFPAIEDLAINFIILFLKLNSNKALLCRKVKRLYSQYTPINECVLNFTTIFENLLINCFIIY